MTIDIRLHEVLGSLGETLSVYAEATVLTSPKEGYDPAKLAAFERDLDLFVNKRVNDALKPEEVRKMSPCVIDMWYGDAYDKARHTVPEIFWSDGRLLYWGWIYDAREPGNRGRLYSPVDAGRQQGARRQVRV